MRKPTLQSLAQELGVSRQTVSNALNAPEKVHPATRERVLQAIEASGYRPSAAARSLRRQKAEQIALRLRHHWGGPNAAVMWRFVNALTLKAHEAGYNIILLRADDDLEETQSLKELFLTRSIDGAILTDSHFEDARPDHLTAQRAPFVAFGRPWGNPEAEHCWVDIDGAEGIRLAVAHLRRQGCRKLGYIGSANDKPLTLDRRQAWAEAVAPDQEDVAALSIGCGDSLDDAAAAVDALLEQGVDGIVCGTDRHAAVARTRLTFAGPSVPLVGFGDTPTAEAMMLTSVLEPVEEAAAIAIDCLIRQIVDPTAPKCQTMLSPSLVVRQ